MVSLKSVGKWLELLDLFSAGKITSVAGQYAWVLRGSGRRAWKQKKAEKHSRCFWQHLRQKAGDLFDVDGYLVVPDDDPSVALRFSYETFRAHWCALRHGKCRHTKRPPPQPE